MHRLFFHLFVAVFTFAIGTVASLFFSGVLSRSPEMAGKSTIVTMEKHRIPPLLAEFDGPISSRCRCRESFTESEPADADAAPRAPINGGVLNGRAISLPEPTYPPIARAARASGTVTVRILVDERGCIQEARALSGHPLLQVASVAAARNACFAPTRLSGEPMKVTGVLTYNFVHQQGGTQLVPFP